MGNEEIFWPRKVKLVDIWINTAGAFISWVIGSVLLLLVIFWLSGMIDLPWNFKDIKITIWWNNPIFPIILSFITFIVTFIVSVTTYYFLHITDPNKYKKNIIFLWHISLFCILIYLIISPVYIYSGIESYDNIMTVFLIHVLFLSFWINILLEIMNNYRYILLWFYGSFIWLFLTGIIIFFIFSMFATGYAKLLSLLFILPLINWLMVFFKWIFEWIYYQYYLMSWKDQLWDIFSQIEQEEMDEYNQAMNENNTYN